MKSVSMRYMRKDVTEVRLGRERSYPAVNLRPGQLLRGDLEFVGPLRDVLNRGKGAGPLYSSISWLLVLGHPVGEGNLG